MNIFSIRSATEEDREFILSLLKSKLSSYGLHKEEYYNDQKKIREKRPLEIIDVEFQSVFITCHNDVNVGAHKIFFENKEKFSRIYWLASTETEKGVGSFIIDHAKIFASSQSHSKIWLSVNRNNRKAIKCYEANGFIPATKNGDQEEIIMEYNNAN